MLSPPFENTVQAAFTDPYVFVSPTIQHISDWFSLLTCPLLFRSRFSQDFTDQAAAVFLHPQPSHDTGFPSSLSLMTERHISDMLLSADTSTPTSHSPATTTTHTDPPTPQHGYFLPTNPMPYMAPSATHQPELLLLYWLIDTIATLADSLMASPHCPRSRPPDVLFHEHTSIPTLPHFSIPAGFSRLTWPLSHGSDCDFCTGPHQLPFRSPPFDLSTTPHNS